MQSALLTADGVLLNTCRGLSTNSLHSHYYVFWRVLISAQRTRHQYIYNTLANQTRHLNYARPAHSKWFHCRLYIRQQYRQNENRVPSGAFEIYIWNTNQLQHPPCCSFSPCITPARIQVPMSATNRIGPFIAPCRRLFERKS